MFNLFTVTIRSTLSQDLFKITFRYWSNDARLTMRHKTPFPNRTNYCWWFVEVEEIRAESWKYIAGIHITAAATWKQNLLIFLSPFTGTAPFMPFPTKFSLNVISTRFILKSLSWQFLKNVDETKKKAIKRTETNKVNYLKYLKAKCTNCEGWET